MGAANTMYRGGPQFGGYNMAAPRNSPAMGYNRYFPFQALPEPGISTIPTKRVIARSVGLFLTVQNMGGFP